MTIKLDPEAVKNAQEKYAGMTLNEMFTAIADTEISPATETAQVPAQDFVTTDGHGRITDAISARTFILGGNATFTLVSVKTGTRFTYKVRLPKDGDGNFFFVSVLNGPDNWTNYQYFGYIRRGIFFHGGAKARAGQDAPSVRAFTWAWNQIIKGNLPESLEFYHEGKCGRCGRLLTVPSSVSSGFGPECIGKI